jgi:hypothetical protein
MLVNAVANEWENLGKEEEMNESKKEYEEGDWKEIVNENELNDLFGMTRLHAPQWTQF